MTTTIKVSNELRDRLKAQASRAGLTLGAHLAVLADAADRRNRLADLKRAIADSSADVIAAHREESALWEVVELTDAQSLGSTPSSNSTRSPDSTHG